VGVGGGGVIGLTDRQAQVLVAIEASIKTRGFAPTLRELCALLNMQSTNAASDHLNALERKGYIVRGDRRARTICVVKPITSPAKSKGDPGKFVKVQRCPCGNTLTLKGRCSYLCFDAELAPVAKAVGL
jgi:SOS-response transcriptional repressor LexA